LNIQKEKKEKTTHEGKTIKISITKQNMMYLAPADSVKDLAMWQMNGNVGLKYYLLRGLNIVIKLSFNFSVSLFYFIFSF